MMSSECPLWACFSRVRSRDLDDLQCHWMFRILGLVVKYESLHFHVGNKRSRTFLKAFSFDCKVYFSPLRRGSH